LVEALAPRRTMSPFVRLVAMTPEETQAARDRLVAMAIGEPAIADVLRTLEQVWEWRPLAPDQAAPATTVSNRK
jgi:hypothetical protein